MHSIKERYSELIALTQVYLLREHSIKDRIVFSQTEYPYFKNRTPQTISSPRETQQPPLTVQPPISAKQPLPPQQKITVSQTQAPLLKKPPTSPTPPTEQKKEEPHRSALPPLEPLKPAFTNASSFNDFKQIMKDHFAHIPLREEIPTDEEAQKINNRWKTAAQPSVVILAWSDDEKCLAFLQQLASAITRHLAPAKVVMASQLNNLPPSLQIMITHEKSAALIPENLKRTQFLLPDIQLYFRDSKNKSSLWKALCAHFETHFHDLM